MRISRVLLFIGLLLFVGALAVGGFLFFRSRMAVNVPEEVLEEGTPVPEPQNLVQIVVAAQNVPRGLRITEDANAITLQNWPDDAVPVGAISNLESVYGRIARSDIVLGAPVLEEMLTDAAGDLAAAGSEAALHIPSDRVAYAMPVSRYSSTAWALQPGDHVDVLISLLVADLDEEFQSILPNNASCVSPPEGEECSIDVLGRLEMLPNGWLVNVTPAEEQHARLVTQMTVQDALVLRVGEWPRESEPVPTPVQEQAAETAAAEEVESTPPPMPSVEPLTLAVTRQDAMVLEYAQAVGARMSLVLRPAGDAQAAATDSVTLQYMMDRFSIELPPKLPYGVVPPVTQLDRLGQTDSAAQYGASAQPVETGGGE